MDRDVGQYERDEIKVEIERCNEWANNITVIKIKNFTHVLKFEFQNVEAVNRALENGLLMFHMFVSPDQITRDEFVNILTCF